LYLCGSKARGYLCRPGRKHHPHSPSQQVHLCQGCC
jgi:hypothetical protein